MSPLRKHITYANVMATLAVFVALGGSAYAAAKINGGSIKPHSIPANRLEKDAVVDHAKLSDRTTQLLVSGSARKGRRERSGDARELAAEAGSDGLVKLSVGDTKTILSSDPFSFDASCVGGPSGSAKLELYAKTTEAGAIEADNVIHASGTPLEPGAPVEVANVSFEAGQMFTPGVGRVALAAPSGATLNVGAYNVGIHVLGADCVISMFGVA